MFPGITTAANGVVYISEAIRRQARLWGFSLAPGRSAVVPSLSARLVKSRKNPRPTQTWAGRSLRLVMIGARYSHKNAGVVLAFLDAHREWLKPRGVQVVIVGLQTHGIPQDLLDSLVAGGLLEIRDYVEDGELEAFLGSARCLLYPSYCEGQGLPPLEAMSLGCVPVCSDLPVLRETCGDAALFFPPDDPSRLFEQVRFLCEEADEDWIAGWRARAETVLSRYDIETIGSRWLTALRDFRICG
ncbi:MAG: glycosyltransferase [Terrimicrobiaceae bacterium]|nr:glycosyltransferase [Terrimicrobiaceae bacterium]